jgi:preprotein translocase subunit Sec63
MKAITAATIQEAAEVLQITERASLNEIRRRYQELMKKWHPDMLQNTGASSHEKTILLNESYRILVEYCMNYQFSFRTEDITQNLEKSPAEYWMERFGDDPIWSRMHPDRRKRS